MRIDEITIVNYHGVYNGEIAPWMIFLITTGKDGKKESHRNNVDGVALTNINDAMEQLTIMINYHLDRENEL